MEMKYTNFYFGEFEAYYYICHLCGRAEIKMIVRNFRYFRHVRYFSGTLYNVHQRHRHIPHQRV